MAVLLKTPPALQRLLDNIETVIKGKTEVVRLAVVSLLARGHALFEDVPGVGKTALAHSLARSISSSFQRIQFTADLMPSDIIGVTIYDPDTREFEFRRGPLFANIVLADEINRATAKTQSSLLEAMNTGHVTVDKFTHALPKPFIVLATLNPIEFHGTFPLPKSQMDRFLVRLSLGYPGRADEIAILREQKALDAAAALQPVCDAAEILAMQEETQDVEVEESLLEYIVRIAEATRQSPEIDLGVSVRGTLSLRRAAQAYAYLEGRSYVVPDDIKRLVAPVLAHRIQAARAFESGSLNGLSLEERRLAEILETVACPS